MYKMILLVSLHSFLDKNSVYEVATFLKVYASLVSFPGGQRTMTSATRLHSVVLAVHFSDEYRRRRLTMQNFFNIFKYGHKSPQQFYVRSKVLDLL